MKVLIIGNRLFSVDLQWGFVQAGHTAQIVAPATAEQLHQILNVIDPDLLITLGAPLELKPEVMRYIGTNRPAKLKYIHWDTDGISSTYYSSTSGDGIEMDIIYASKPDLVLTMCPDMRNFILQKGYACEMMYYAYSPISHHPIANTENKGNFINLIGNSYINIYPDHPEHYRYHSLKILLKPLLENGYTIHIYGDTGYLPLIQTLFGIDVPRENYHGFLPYERTCSVYNSSFINIVTQNHYQTITKRTFEILGSGGFVLSSDNEELRKLFVPGRDLAVSSSPEQTLELVHFYENNPDQWRSVRQNAVLSVQNHTYKQRAEFIVEQYKKLVSF